MWCFQNPVEIISGDGSLDSLITLIGDKPYAVVTYTGELFSQYTSMVVNAVGTQPVCIIDGVVENPHFQNLTALCSQLASYQVQPEIIIALGGGSVMDTAKVLAASNGCFSDVERLLKNEISADELRYTPIVALPTTAGTGSEVTCWATVWDPKNNTKYSLSDPRLYPVAAIVHAPFTAQLPVSITVSTGLDALSHALESLWNKNQNPISAAFAVTAAKIIIQVLPQLTKTPEDLALRTTMQEAALMAGLAFSNTKTSIAHNMSYAVTLDKGVPHGIACSFTLPSIINAVDPSDTRLVAYIEAIFGQPLSQAARKMTQLLHELDVATEPTAYGYSKEEWQAVVETASQGQRGKNFSGDIQRLITQFN